MKNLICLLWLTASFAVSATILDVPRPPANTQQNSPDVKWGRLTTEHFRIIFPRPLESEARRVAGMLEVLYAPVAESLKVQPRPIDIILQAHTLNSNGFVTMAPRRSEFFTAPWLGTDVGQTEWLKTLSVHEFRHVVQFEKSRAGFAKALRFVFGETGTALAVGLTLPPWYMEGDAVGIETALSSGGRGRLPQFSRDLRTLLLDGQEYSYEKLALGSYEHYIPNHYIVGYHLTTCMRRRFGKDVLEKVHADSMERAYNPLTFYSSVERQTGVPFNDVYSACLDELTKLWRAQDALVQLSPMEEIPVSKIRGWTQFQFPLQVKGDEVIAFREGLAHIGQFVRIRPKQEAEVLWTPSPLIQRFPFKSHGGFMAYSETVWDGRWGVKDRTRVVVKDLSNFSTLFNGEGNWLLPVVDSNKRLAVYEWSPEGEPSIVVWQIPEQKLLFEIPWRRDQTVMGMDWIPGSDRLIVLHREGTYDLVFKEINLVTQRQREIARSPRWNWAYPSATADHVYFQSSASGIDNIHRISFNDALEERVTSERFGAYHPSVQNGVMLYARYTPDGLRPVKHELSRLPIFPPGPDGQVAYHSPLVDQEDKGDLLKGTPFSDAPVEDYQQTENFWNAHSWNLIAPVLGSYVAPYVVSTNLLNTFEWINGVMYYDNEGTAQAFTALRWSYYFPVIDFRAVYGGRHVGPERPTYPQSDRWEESSAELGVTLPWKRVQGRWAQAFSLRGFSGILHATGRDHLEVGELNNDTLRPFGAEVNLESLQRTAHRDLLPAWGVQAAGKWQEAPSINGGSADSFHKWALVRPFMPGLAPHHSLYGQISQEEQRRFGYEFNSPILFPRGHKYHFMESSSQVSANYLLPLVYTDWNLSRFYYLKRISLNAFYDHAVGERYGVDRDFESWGGELWFDSHFVRNWLPIQWGLRWARPLGKEDNWELFLNTGLASF